MMGGGGVKERQTEVTHDVCGASRCRKIVREVIV